jgi:transcriptional regulator with XRE-family HTH domain
MVDKLDGAGEAIRDLRTRSGLSLAQMAERLRCDKGLLSKYENGRLGLPHSIIKRLADVIGEPPELVLLYCLQRIYPKLASEASKTGNLLRKLVAEIEQLKSEVGS